MSAKIYHVAKIGCDQNPGTQEEPFLTIQKAADVAVAGDRIIVHQGEYREWVKPRNGGLSNDYRIIYEAAEGEHVVIKGSERITGWKKVEDTVWKVCVPNSIFGSFNPYVQKIIGDWMVAPWEKNVHVGEVYLNGKSFYEVHSFEEVLHPIKRFVSTIETWENREEAIREPEQTVYQWFCQVDNENTIIYANFHGVDPNQELVEINVRRSCFFPETIGLNYITVRGFEMAQAATTWAPPTDDQPGLIGPNWSKGWIIENNYIHDSKCSAVSLGKEVSTGNGAFSKWHRKTGYHYQMEAVFKAQQIGWSKEHIGSHIVRNNKIYDCGQNGIVGHLGCIFSEIYGNEIYNIAVKHEFYGHEIAGIKLHAAIDVQIHNNYIHNCTLGTWLDWQAQGARVSCNIYNQNNRDFFVEVSHGPYLVDNNIFTSPYCFVNAAQGGAYVHNLCCGFQNRYPVLDRSTPYHFPHSTQIRGMALVYSGDDRWYQNIFVGGAEESHIYSYGTRHYNESPISIDEYVERGLALGHGDMEQFDQIKQPVYIDGNVYLQGAKAFSLEENCCLDNCEPATKITEEGNEVILEITLPEEMFQLKTNIITSKKLGMTRLSEGCYEKPDGSEIIFDQDMTGQRRDKKPVAGPLENLHAGKNRIVVWRRGK